MGRSPQVSDNPMIRRGDFLIIAIRCDDAEGDEPVNAEIAFDDVTLNGMKAWLRELAEYRGVERGQA